MQRGWQMRPISFSNTAAIGLGRILLRNCAFRDSGLVLPRLRDLEEDLFVRRLCECRQAVTLFRKLAVFFDLLHGGLLSHPTEESPMIWNSLLPRAPL